jgi:hypothetical protein
MGVTRLHDSATLGSSGTEEPKLGRDEQRRASTLARQLLAGWHARMETPLVGTRRRPFTQPQLAVAHGLGAHVHYLAPPALDLLDRGVVLAALPLVRQCYEHAVTAQWVTQTADGAQAFINEDVRQRRAHIRTLERAVSNVFNDAASAISDTLVEELETSATARRFDAICDDLRPGGADAYVSYGALSQFSHPSAVVVDSYLRLTVAPPGLGLAAQPEEPNAAAWTHILASSLVWAGRAIDYMDKAHHRRSELRAAARELGITSELQLSDVAVKRQARSGRRKAQSPDVS